MKEDKRDEESGKKARIKKEQIKKEQIEKEQNDYDNFELEFKMMENQMYSWLISSAYPQVNSLPEKNNNRKTGKKEKSLKNNKSKGD